MLASLLTTTQLLQGRLIIYTIYVVVMFIAATQLLNANLMTRRAPLITAMQHHQKMNVLTI